MIFYKIIENIRKDIENYFNIDNLDQYCKFKFKYSFTKRQKISFARALYLYFLYYYGFTIEFIELGYYIKSINKELMLKDIKIIEKYKKQYPIKFTEIIENIPSLYLLESQRLILKNSKIKNNL